MAKASLTDPDIQARLRAIRLFILDVDGVLTDSRIQWIKGQGWTRKFSVRDGYGLKRLKNVGIEVAIITAGDSEDVIERAKSLSIVHVYSGSEDKLVYYEELKTKLGLEDKQIAYIGDDLFDIPVLERVGFSATVPGAVPEVKAMVDYITAVEGGFGATREISDAILDSRA